MTKVEFEVATLADALREANVIAPLKGTAADKYAGFYLEIRPSDEGDSVFLRCTNGTVFYTKQVEVLKIIGIDQDWRLASQHLAAFAASIPAGGGRTMTLERQVIEDSTSPSGYRYTNIVRVMSGKAKADMRLIPTEDYPDWEAFDTTDFPQVNGFGDKIERVSWAVANDGQEVLKGVYLDGEFAIATDRYKVAMQRMEVALPEPITVPLGVIAPILKQVQDVRLGVVGSHLCIAPNDYTQIKVVIYDETFPDLSVPLSKTHEQAVMISRDAVSSAVQRVLSIGSADRQIALHVTIGNGEINFYAESDGPTESVEDSVELVGGQGEHEPVHYAFGPSHLQDAISKAPAQDMIFHYNLSTQARLVKLETSVGYTGWVMPRKGAVRKA